MKKIKIKEKEILAFYDLPQLFTGINESVEEDNIWVCLLIESIHTPKYLSIHIPNQTLERYTSGKIDLRELFTSVTDYFLVIPDPDGNYQAEPYEIKDDVTKECLLPDPGFYHS